MGWRCITIVYAVVIVLLAVLPISVPSDTPVGPLDKPAHVCEYLLFAWCLVQLALASGYSLSTTLVLAFGLPLVLGSFLEGVQMWLPYRSAELGDVIANMIGAFSGLCLGLLIPAPRRAPPLLRVAKQGVRGSPRKRPRPAPGPGVLRRAWWPTEVPEPAGRRRPKAQPEGAPSREQRR